MSNPPLNLLVVAHDLQGRGMERAIVRLLREFDRELLRPTLAVASYRGDFLSSVPDDVFVYDLGVGRGRTSRSFGRLLQLIRRTRPDCALGVHISSGRLLGLSRLIYPRLRAVSAEGGWPFSYIESQKGHLAMRTLISRQSYRLLSHVIVSSEIARDDLVDRLGVARAKIELIPHPCVDEEMDYLMGQPATEDPFGDSDHDPIVINVGNMHPHKDQITLISAFAEVIEEIPAHLVFVGDGPIRNELEAFARDLGIWDRVWFLGFQSNPFKYLARSTVYVSPSIAEGFDMSQVEAMACGLPAIVTDGPRFSVVQHNVTGLVVPSRRSDELANALRRILRSPDLSASWGERGKQVAQEYSVKKIARRYEKVLRTTAGPET